MGLDKLIETEERCIRQGSKPKIPNNLPGYGDCLNCKYDPVNNPKCKGYYKIKYYKVQVM